MHSQRPQNIYNYLKFSIINQHDHVKKGSLPWSPNKTIRFTRDSLCIFTICDAYLQQLKSIRNVYIS